MQLPWRYNIKHFKLSAAGISLLAIGFSLPLPMPVIASSMLLHMAVQLPLLLFAGYCWAQITDSHAWPWPMTVSAWIWIYSTVVFWMLPIHLDKTLMFPLWDVAKILSLLLAGWLLQRALQAAIVWGVFFIGSLAIGLIFVGVYYQQADVRVCSNYLIASQQHAGLALFGWGVVLLFFLLIKNKHKLLQ